MEHKVQKATIFDRCAISKFTDFWLAGRGLRIKAPGAVNDYFISPSQHTKYIEHYSTYIIREGPDLIAWAVIQNDGSLIHMLVAGTHRHQGIGSLLLGILKPPKIHSKSDQSSGDPKNFYEKNGYTFLHSVKSQSRWDINKIKPNRKKNIDIFQLQT